MRRLAPLAWLPLLALQGCGVVGGSVVDAVHSAATYPFREYVFQGAYRYENPWDEPWRRLPWTHDEGDVLVGLCVSGGGSRAAYFAACVMDELGRRPCPGGRGTWLDEVDYVSSVSGGSLASAYYCLNRRREGFPSEHGAFFERMKEDMRRNFEVRALARLVLGFRWVPLELTYYNRGHLVAGVWDGLFLDNKTFADLPPDGPALCVNAVSYETGQKFVFTTLDGASLEGGALFRDLVKGRLLSRGSTRKYEPLRNLTLETLDSDPGPLELSAAVAASAAVPNLIGPVRLRDRATGGEHHLGDGGLYDNHGLETMLQLLTHRLETGPARRAVVIVIDAAGWFETGEASGDPTTVAEFMDRTMTISWLRTSVYAEAVFRRVQDEGAERRIELRVISLYDDESLEAAEPAESPKPGLARRALRSLRAGFVDPWQDIARKLRAVGTRLSLGEDDAAAIEVAARRVVPAALEGGR